MNRISDALELLTAHHDEIEALLSEIATTADLTRRSIAIGALCDQLTLHLAAEQELLYPAVSTAMSTAVHTELVAEHTEIKRLLADLIWLEHDDQRLERKLSALRTLIGYHTTWQERDLFEAVAERHSADELARLGADISGWMEANATVHREVALAA